MREGRIRGIRAGIRAIRQFGCPWPRSQNSPRAMRRIASTDLSTSASVVAHEITLTRIAVFPCHASGS